MPELYGDFALFAIAEYREYHRIIGLFIREIVREFGVCGYFLAVDFGDDVAALEAGIGCGGAGDDCREILPALQPGASIYAEFVGFV